MSRSTLQREGSVPNLYIRHYSTGRRTYMLVVEKLGKKKWISLGCASRIGLDEVKTLAASQLHALSHGAPLSDLTFKALSERWLSSHSHLKTIRTCKNELTRFVTPRIGKVHVKSLTIFQLEDLHKEWSATGPYAANRRIEIISSVLGYGMRLGIIETNPARLVTRNREKPRRTYATREQLQDIIRAIEKEPHPPTRLAFMFMLFTGLRKSEVLSLRWEDVDKTDYGIFVTVRDTKNGRDHTVPLPPQLESRLGELKKSGWVFKSRLGDGHLSRIENAWGRIRLRAGLPDLRIHDLRRTWGSLAVQAGIPLHFVSDALNHSSLEVTKRHYAHLDSSHRKLVTDRVAIEIGK